MLPAPSGPVEVSNPSEPPPQKPGPLSVAGVNRPSFRDAVQRHLDWKLSAPTKWRKPMRKATKRMYKGMSEITLALCPSWELFDPWLIWEAYRFFGKKVTSELDIRKELPRRKDREHLVSGGNHMATYLRSLVPWLVKKGWAAENLTKAFQDIVNTVVTPRDPQLPPTKNVLELINQLKQEDEFVGLYVHLLATTGLRKGLWDDNPKERHGALGLIWEDIDWPGKRIETPDL